MVWCGWRKDGKDGNGRGIGKLDMGDWCAKGIHVFNEVESTWETVEKRMCGSERDMYKC